MLAGGERHQHLRVVRIIVRGDRDHVDVGVVEDGPRVARQPPPGMAPPERGELLLVDVAERRDAATPVLLVCGNVALADAEPDDCRPQRHAHVADTAERVANCRRSATISSSPYSQCGRFIAAIVATKAAKSSAVSTDS